MKGLLQRVSSASVIVEGQKVGSIRRGILLLLGIGRGDGEKEARELLHKVLNLRIFEDSEGRFHHSLLDVGGGLLIVSQFTLYADCRKGRRPSFTDAAPPETAQRLYDYFVKEATRSGLEVATGVFGAKMEVHLINDGPVTISIEIPPKGKRIA